MGNDWCCTMWKKYKETFKVLTSWKIPFPESMTAEPTFPKKPAIAMEQLRNPSTQNETWVSICSLNFFTQILYFYSILYFLLKQTLLTWVNTCVKPLVFDWFFHMDTPNMIYEKVELGVLSIFKNFLFSILTLVVESTGWLFCSSGKKLLENGISDFLTCLLNFKLLQVKIDHQYF